MPQPKPTPMNEQPKQHPAGSGAQTKALSPLSPQIPPQAIEVEKAVLGAMLIDKRAVTEAVDKLMPEMFYDPKHQYIFRAMFQLFESGSPIDYLTVTDKLKTMGLLNDVGGPYYLIELSNTVATAVNIETHILILIEKYIRREMIDTAQRMQTKAFDETNDVFDILDEAEQSLFSISQGSLRQETEQVDSILVRVKEKLETMHKENKKIPGLSSGFPSIDDFTGGWHKGDLIILAGRTAMGKTALALNLAKNIAFIEKKPVAFFSLEMTAEQLMMRILSSMAMIESTKFRSGKFSENEFEILESKTTYLSNNPNLFINDSSMLNIFELRTQARRMKVQFGIEIIFIDYLQLIRSGDKLKSGNREQEIANISRSLKALAKELDIPIIALSQLSRKVEDRYRGNEHRRPQLSDLRESGAIEQDADMVAFVYRPEYYKITEWDDEEHSPTENTAEFIIAKHRHGKTGSIRLRFLKDYGLFEDMSQPAYLESSLNKLSDDVLPGDINDAFGTGQTGTQNPNPEGDDMPF